MLSTLVGLPVFIYHFGGQMNWWIHSAVFVGMFIASGLSITLGYHRLFSHISFKAKWPVRLFTLIFGATAMENSALEWCSDHRRHHKHTDDDNDPYNIQLGFLHAGIVLSVVHAKGCVNRDDHTNALFSKKAFGLIVQGRTQKSKGNQSDD